MIALRPSAGRRVRPLLGALAALALVLLLAGCRADDDAVSSDHPVATSALSPEPLRVGVSPVPHAEILRFVQATLAGPTGLTLEVREYADYVLPNRDLARGALDANYFQTPDHLRRWGAEHGDKLHAVVGVHVEPLAVYGRPGQTEIRLGASMALPNEPSTRSRALKLLAAAGVVALRDPDADDLTLADVVENERKLRFDEVDPARTPRALDDHDLAVINGNYALEAGLRPREDAILIEEAKGNPNANLLVTNEEGRDDPRVKALGELLTSPQVKRFIRERYGNGIIPAAAP